MARPSPIRWARNRSGSRDLASARSRRAGYGYAIGAFLAWAYVKPAHAAPGAELEVMVLGAPRRARVLAEAAWDPENARPRADQRLAAE